MKDLNIDFNAMTNAVSPITIHDRKDHKTLWFNSWWLYSHLGTISKVDISEQIFNPKFQVAGKYFECDSLLIVNQHSLICMYLFLRDIGLEAIRQAGFYRVIDVRQMEGYPTRTDENGLVIQNPANEFHNLRYRAFTM